MYRCPWFGRCVFRNSGPRGQVILNAALLLAISLFTGCSTSPVSVDESASPTPQDPPFPHIKSILPLQKGIQWTYSDTWYDADGDTIISRSSLSLQISRIYGRSDSNLTMLEPWAYRDTFDEYVYGHEWEHTDSGYLLAYRDYNLASTPGVYIVGKFKKKSEWMYRKPMLWLAYPADSGTSYSFSYPGRNDTESITMEILSKEARFYSPQPVSNHVSAARFYNCYLYKQTSGNSVSYYYYTSEVGAVGYVRYENGTLRRTYILTSLGREYYY